MSIGAELDAALIHAAAPNAPLGICGLFADLLSPGDRWETDGRMRNVHHP